jgi:hypothetical protein
MTVSENYRIKALVSERFAGEAKDPAIRDAWIEIGIEWHALAYRMAGDSEIDISWS